MVIRMNNSIQFPALAFSLCLLCLQAAQAQDIPDDATLSPESAKPSLFDFFYSRTDSIPALTLKTDWGLLIRTKQDEKYQPGVLGFVNQDGRKVELDVELRARGNARKKVCQLPPLKIKAGKRYLRELGFNPEYKLKLVLPCQPGKVHEDCLLREALAYELCSMAIPIHFRTKIVTLQCWQDDKEKHTHYAFLIEEKEELAARLNGRLLTRGEIRVTALERDLYLRMCFFQHMIANTDWSVSSRHNLQFLHLPGYNRVVAVPYDFDYAGLVNTSYAIPGSTIPVEDVSQRYFQGEEITQEEARECAAFFLSRREQVLQRCQSFDMLKEKSRESVRDFLEIFFDILSDEELMLQTFANAKDGD